MNWEAIGAVAEALGAAGVIATLAYLAVQIRANTTALRVEARRAEMSSGSDFIQTVASSEQVSDLFLQGLQDPKALSPRDLLRFSLLLGQYMGAEATHYEEVEIGFIGRETLSRRRAPLVTFLDTAGGRFWWRHYSDMMPPSFRSYVEKEFVSALSPN